MKKGEGRISGGAAVLAGALPLLAAPIANAWTSAGLTGLYSVIASVHVDEGTLEFMCQMGGFETIQATTLAWADPPGVVDYGLPAGPQLVPCDDAEDLDRVAYNFLDPPMGSPGILAGCAYLTGNWEEGDALIASAWYPHNWPCRGNSS